MTLTPADLTGTVVLPDDPDYDAARGVFNAAIDRRPEVIVRPRDAPDVAGAVLYARDRGLALAVRGGGHSFAGHGVSDGGLMLDMRGFDTLDVDVEGRTAWAGAGLTAGAYTAAVGEHALATGFGDTPSVGVAGITLGGGVGWLARRHGLTIDNLLAVELVTADGELVIADAERHADLFWALRGGGGNFGVATRLRFALVELDAILGGLVVLPARADVLAGAIDAAAAAPDELSTIIHVTGAPPAPFLPAEHHGKPVVMVLFAHAGDPAAGEAAVAPLRSLADPIVELVQAMPYPDIYTFLGGGPERAAFAARNAFTDAVDAAAVVARVSAGGDVQGVVQIRVLGGAVARVAPDATAYAHREWPMMVVAAAVSMQPGPQPQLGAWTDATLELLGLTGRPAYVNYSGEASPEAVRLAYPGATYERLAAVKRRYDPGNLFRSNHNVS